MTTNLEMLKNQQQAELLKNSLDSLFLLRDRTSEWTAEDEKLFNKVINALYDLRLYLEATHDYPRWVDMWGARRGWQQISK